MVHSTAPGTMVGDLCAEIDALSADLEQAKEERDELQLTLDLKWDAIRRATQQWHEAGGDKNTLPDIADLVLWLLTERDSLREQLKLSTKQLNLGAEALHNMSVKRERAEEALRCVLLSMDCEWENRNMGHDWAECCEQIRSALSRQPDEGEPADEPTPGGGATDD